MGDEEMHLSVDVGLPVLPTDVGIEDPQDDRDNPAEKKRERIIL